MQHKDREEEGAARRGRARRQVVEGETRGMAEIIFRPLEGKTARKEERGGGVTIYNAE